MASMSDAAFVAMNIPVLSSGTISKNGFSFNVGDFIQQAIDTAGNKELAIAMIFDICAADNVFESEKLDQYGYTKQNMREIATDWRARGVAQKFGDDGVAPTVQPGGVLGLPILPNIPAIR